MTRSNTDMVRFHTAARRYCIDRHDYWLTYYWNTYYSKGDRDSPEARATYPRYNVLKAILDDIERFHPDAFFSVEEARSAIVAAGQRAENMLTGGPNDNTQQSVMNEERQLFANFVSGISTERLQEVEPLFSRRVLTPDESQGIRSALRQRWNIEEHYCYPLDGTVRNDVVAFDVFAFDDAVGPDELRRILAKHGVEDVWELREYGPEYILELSAVEPYYNLAEGYWCSSAVDWVIYASHEQSITLGGEWLLEDIKQVWPDWEQHIWRFTL